MISFGDIAELVFKRLLMRKVVYFAADQYKPKSAKSLEHEERKVSDGMMWVQIEKREQKWLKQWKKYQKLSKEIGAC